MQSRLQNQINYDQNFKNVYIKNLICKQSIHTQLEENQEIDSLPQMLKFQRFFYSLCFYILSNCSIMSMYYYFLNQGEKRPKIGNLRKEAQDWQF